MYDFTLSLIPALDGMGG